jgi:hypothetical protein
MRGRARYDRLFARADHHRGRFRHIMPDDAIKRRFGGHGDDGIDRTRINILPLDDAVVEAGQHITRAPGGFGFTLDLELVAARLDIDAETVFDRDEVLIELTEQAAEQLRPIEHDFEAAAVSGPGGNGFTRHSTRAWARSALRLGCWVQHWRAGH